MSEKPNIKDAFKAVLSGDALKNALDFADFLEANEMEVDGAQVSRKSKVMCYMHLEGGENYPAPWTIWTEGDYSGEHCDITPGMKEIAWANVNLCSDCGGSCTPGTRKSIFGKEFDGVCSADMAFYIPGGEALECVKKLLEIRKMAVDDK